MTFSIGGQNELNDISKDEFQRFGMIRRFEGCIHNRIYHRINSRMKWIEIRMIRMDGAKDRESAEDYEPLTEIFSS